MKFSSTIKTAAAAVGIATVAIATAGPASADPQMVKFGQWGKLYDINIITAWKVDAPKPSSATIPGYPVAGKLYESNATVKAARNGGVTPIIPNLNARASDGTNYQVIWQAATPDGIPGATLLPGGSASGKVYFDVTGPSPTKVAYYNGAQDLIIWS
jgi:hypothetical protein